MPYFQLSIHSAAEKQITAHFPIGVCFQFKKNHFNVLLHKEYVLALRIMSCNFIYEATLLRPFSHDKFVTFPSLVVITI